MSLVEDLAALNAALEAAYRPSMPLVEWLEPSVQERAVIEQIEAMCKCKKRPQVKRPTPRKK